MCGFFQLLLEAGADKNCLNNTGSTALYEAVYNGILSIVWLLDWGLILPMENRNRTLDLILVYKFFGLIWLGHTEVVRILLENGCDPNIPDVYGKTPLHIIPFMSVEEEKREQCMQLLLEGMIRFVFIMHSTACMIYSWSHYAGNMVYWLIVTAGFELDRRILYKIRCM